MIFMKILSNIIDYEKKFMKDLKCIENSYDKYLHSYITHIYTNIRNETFFSFY